MFCNKCGFKYEGNFCPMCGAIAKKAPAEPQSVPVNYTNDNPFSTLYNEAQNVPSPEKNVVDTSSEADGINSTSKKRKSFFKKSKRSSSKPPVAPLNSTQDAMTVSVNLTNNSQDDNTVSENEFKLNTSNSETTTAETTLSDNENADIKEEVITETTDNINITKGTNPNAESLENTLESILENVTTDSSQKDDKPEDGFSGDILDNSEADFQPSIAKEEENLLNSKQLDPLEFFDKIQLKPAPLCARHVLMIIFTGIIAISILTCAAIYTTKEVPSILNFTEPTTAISTEAAKKATEASSEIAAEKATFETEKQTEAEIKTSAKKENTVEKIKLNQTFEDKYYTYKIIAFEKIEKFDHKKPKTHYNFIAVTLDIENKNSISNSPNYAVSIYEKNSDDIINNYKGYNVKFSSKNATNNTYVFEVPKDCKNPVLCVKYGDNFEKAVTLSLK